MTKKKKIILGILIILTCFFIWFFKYTAYGEFARLYISLYFEKKLEGFDEHKSDYQLIVDKLIKLRDEGKVVKKDDYLIVEEDILYSVEADKEIKLTFAEKQSLENVKKTIVGEFCEMDTIYINKYIEFASSQCPFSVVYSEDGSKPESLIIESEYVKYKIKMIESKWYTIDADQ